MGRHFIADIVEADIASGKHALADYFDNGNANAVQPICDSLS